MLGELNSPKSWAFESGKDGEGRENLSSWKEQYAQERVTPVGTSDERGGTVPASGA